MYRVKAIRFPSGDQRGLTVFRQYVVCKPADATAIIVHDVNIIFYTKDDFRIDDSRNREKERRAKKRIWMRRVISPPVTQFICGLLLYSFEGKTDVVPLAACVKGLKGYSMKTVEHSDSSGQRKDIIL